MKKFIFTSLTTCLIAMLAHAQTTDPFQYLEEVDSKASLDWVEQQNKGTVSFLQTLPKYQAIYDKSLEIFNSPDRIAYPSIIGNNIYNFWQDKEHVRGIWRRCSKESYMSGSPAWETVLDIDQLSAQDNVKWVYKGASGLYPNYDRFMVSLSKGGGDAVEIKEFDAQKKAFIKDGFSISEAKGSASYWDENTLIVATNFGAGSMTTSGYPRIVKLWKRGTPLTAAQTIFEGKAEDVRAYAYKMRDGDKNYLVVGQGLTFYTSNSYVWDNNKLTKLDLPEDAVIDEILNNQLIVELKSDWKIKNLVLSQGSIVSLNFTELLKGNKIVQTIVAPDQFTSVESVSATKNRLLISTLRNVKSELHSYSFNGELWVKTKVPAQDLGALSIGSVDEFSDEFFFNYQNFLTPSTLYFSNAADLKIKAIKSLPAYFDGNKYKVTQVKVKSKDGTMIPYFMVSSKKMVLNGKNPTLLYSYGGFEVSLLPNYSSITGTAWLENGGVYVLANIRGGGEYGPKWHQAGLKAKRQHIYDDFHAVAADLIKRKVTSSKNLGIMGGSNGGLLVGVAFTQRPDLYNAVICAVPLLDMQRYHKLLAGASWMAEYGDPDKAEEWNFIKQYSPYHNLKKGVKYPEVFFTTSTRDDRVHPGHARKMVAKMTDMGYKVYYYENTEGGHAGSSTNEQRAKSTALQYAYLWMKLKNN